MKKVRLAAIGVPALGMMVMPAVAHATTTPTPDAHGTLTQGTQGKRAGIKPDVVCLQTSSRSTQTATGIFRGSIGFTGTCVARVSARLGYARTGLAERVRFWDAGQKMVAEKFTGGVINGDAIYYLSYPDIFANKSVCEAIVPNSNHDVVKWGPVCEPTG
jgi:hypothetical protein